MRFLLAAVPLLLLSTVGISQAQAPEPVYVVTHIDLMPNGVNPGIAALKQLAAETTKEKDCVRFEVMQQDGRPNHFTVVAIWKNRQAFETHDAAPYSKEFREKLQPFIGSPWDERLHKLIQ
jgi:quinol monooxygenase YgiN